MTTMDNIQEKKILPVLKGIVFTDKYTGNTVLVRTFYEDRNKYYVNSGISGLGDTLKKSFREMRDSGETSREIVITAQDTGE